MAQIGQTRPLPDHITRGLETAEDHSFLQKRALELRARLRYTELDAAARLAIQLELAEILLTLDEGPKAYAAAREALDASLMQERYESAVQACLFMYRSEQQHSISALGQGLWLAVACPIDPELSLEMLRALIEETPADSDGAAVAAMLGYFLMEMRAPEDNQERLVFLARQLVAEVAERHRGITDDESISIWAQMHELDDVDQLLERMAVIIDAITEVWWFDRDALRARFAAKDADGGNDPDPS